MEGAHFQVPVDRQITEESHIPIWQKSSSYQKLLGFLHKCNDRIKGKKISDLRGPHSDVIVRLVGMLDKLEGLLAHYPPIEQPQRFGNKAFRQYHERLVADCPALVAEVLPPHLQGAAQELAPYVYGAFGNPTRLDYGTGHETSFAIFLVCIDQLHLLNEKKTGKKKEETQTTTTSGDVNDNDDDDYTRIPLIVFDRYVRLCRLIQRRYMLEPAGSHGVWSLDDYQFLCFLWGSSQLMVQQEVRPSHMLQRDVVRARASEYLYCAAIDHIHQTKKGPFGEHSPTLYSITNVVTWEKINGGMFKMYEAEVLSKVPIMQHVLFGSLFQRPPI